MSEEYEDDFENCYEEDFESDDGDLEVPDLNQKQHAETACVEELVCPASSVTSQLDTRTWPSLSTSLHSPPLGRKQGAASALFGRPLFAVEPGPVSLRSSSTGAAPTSTGVLITLQPPPPPLSDAQRKQAAAVLCRSMQLQQQAKLHASTQLDLLVLHPLSLYQQYSQGLGVYAGRTAAACQTRQLDQDIREQDVQTDQVEQQPGACQVPEDLYSGSRTQHRQQPGTQQPHKSLPMDLLAASNSAFAGFVDYAVPQVLFELGRADAEAAAESSLVSAAAGPSFAAVQTAVETPGSSYSTEQSQALLAGELQLLGSSLLAGRPLIDITGPPTPQSAAAAAAAIATATSVAGAIAAVSSHLLLACYGPVGMSAAAAVSEHGLAGLGCLCVWDLQAASRRVQVSAAASEGSSLPHGVLQVLVSEGKPTCCCWGAGEAAALVFAGMEEGGVCCWDLAEPDKAHRAVQTPTAPQQQLKQQHQKQPGVDTPCRRPSYSAGLPLFASTKCSTSSGDALDTCNSSVAATVLSGMISDGALAAGGVVALAVVPSTLASSGSYGGAAGSGGGAVCRLVVLSAGGCVTLYSVMLGGAGSDVAGADLGMRSGSRVWLVKLCEGLPLGMEVVKPPHMKRAAALAATTARDAGAKAAPDSSGSSSSRQHCQTQSGCCLLVLPGATQQLLVGTDGGRVLKGAALGFTHPPHEYTSVQWWPGLQHPATSDTDAVPDGSGTGGVMGSSSSSSSSSSSLCGAVISMSVCPLLPDAWVAGHSCGRLALFSQKRSRPSWVWQHPTGAPAVAVRWLPQSGAFVAAFSSSSGSCGSSAAGSLAAFQFSTSAKQPCAILTLRAPTLTRTPAECAAGGPQALAPRSCCMEVLSMSGANSTLLMSYDTSSRDRSLTQASSSNSSRGVKVQAVCAAVAVGFTDGSCSVYQLAAGWSGQSGQEDLEALQALISC